MRTPLALALGSLVLAFALPSFADGGEACEKPVDIDKYAELRRLSYDLRNKPPSIEEYDALESVDAVPLATIQEFIEGDDFRMAMRRYHEQLFWPNLAAAKLKNQNANIDIKDAAAYYIQAAGRQTTYRGAAVDCGNFENNDVDAQGRPNPGSIRTVGGHAQEGWRMVTPYWSTTPIKVCVYDAQETETTAIKGETFGCNTVAGNASKECGCGAGLKYCYTGNQIDGPIRDALREQMSRAVDKVTSAGAPYTDLILSTHADENGPIAFWKKNLAPNASYSVTFNVPDPEEPIPDLQYGQTESWVDVDRGPMHAGLLTMPGYLLRFQTNRGRANRFRIVFTNQYFIPPDQLDPAPGCDPNANDLTQRCNCQYCHSKLEPIAAHWGRFSEAGTTLLTDTVAFPLEDPDCVDDTPNSFCARFYVTDSAAENPGALLPFQYSKVHKEYVSSIEKGPKVLAQEIIADGTFASATVTELFTFFMKRDPITDGSIFDEQKTLEALASGFAKNHYDFAWLTQQIVTLRQYRRTR